MPIHPIRSRTLTAIAVVFALALVLPAFAQEPAEPFSDDPDAVVIAFGDTTISKAEFDRAFDVAARSTAIGQGLPVTEEVLAEFEPFRLGFLEQYATQRVLAEEAEDRGLAADDAAVDEVVGQLRQEQADADAFQAWLDSAGYGDEQVLRATLQVNLSVQALVDDLALGIDIDSEDVVAWYESNPEAVTSDDGSMVPLEAVEDQIAQLLVQEALEVEVQAITAAAGLELSPGGL